MCSPGYQGTLCDEEENFTLEGVDAVDKHSVIFIFAILMFLNVFLM